MKEAFLLEVGWYVAKTTGYYTFQGVVLTRFHTQSGVARYVIEDSRGMLIIGTNNQFERVFAA